MSPDENGVLKFVHAKNLYRDWGSIKACLKAFSLTIAICFALVLSLIGCAGGMKSDDFLFQCKIWGCIFLGFWLMTFICWFILAWAKGGVDEWEYEVKPWHVKGRKIIRHPGRMKALRFFAGLGLLMSTRPGQTQALRGLLRDSEKKEFDILLFNDAEVTGDEKTGTIELESHGQSEEIHVSPEDYAHVLEYITFNPKRRRKTASKTTKKEVAS